MDELAQWLRERRTLTPSEVESIEHARDEHRGAYAPHTGTHHSSQEARH